MFNPSSLHRLCLIAMLTLIVPLAAQYNSGAQSGEQTAKQPIVIGEQFTIHSKTLGEDRQIWVSRPAGYEQSTERFPVMYLLDGNAHFHHTTGIIQFLANLGRMPQMLVVGIPNTQRTRDLTPPTNAEDQKRFATAGGADNFRAFLTKELMPHIEKNYRTHPYRILTGHSFGGLFAVHTLLSEPEAFNAYIAISPSMWWNNRALLASTEAFLEKNPNIQKQFFMTLGNEEGDMRPSVDGMVNLLETKAPKGLKWKFVLMEEETHGSVPHRSTYQALEKFYTGWQIVSPAALAAGGGIEAFDAHYKRLAKKFGYQVTPGEGTVNQLGYYFLGQKDYKTAIELFERNVKNFPKSANVYDSLGDGYDANNQPRRAHESYLSAVKLAEEGNHPNLNIYRANLDRMAKKLAAEASSGSN